MTDVISPIIPIGSYIPPYMPLSNITPFTYRDGLTYLEVLECLRTYVNTTLVDFVNTNFGILGDDFSSEVNTLIEAVNTQLDAQTTTVNTAIANLTTYVDTSVSNDTAYVDAQIATMQTTVNQAVTDVENSAITLQDTVLAGIVNNSASASNISLKKRYYSVITPEAYGAIGDGVTDDTMAIIAAFNAAKNLRRQGLTASIFQPGATVVLNGTYNLATLATPIEVSCNVNGSTATLIAPTNYASTVILVGCATSGNILQDANIELPDIIKTNSVDLTVGSTAVKVQNLYNSDIKFSRIAYYETGINFTGLGNGTAYNRIFIGWLSYVKVGIKLIPDVGGWVNQNTFVGGGIQQSPSFPGGTLISGWRHMILDGLNINAVNGNTFIGVSFEGDSSEYCLYFHNANKNVFIGTRFEQGTSGISLTVSGSNITWNNHTLNVNDIISFAATTMPTGMIAGIPYYVSSIVDANTITVSRSKNGVSIIFSDAGVGVLGFKPSRIYYDGSSGVCTNNVINDPATILGVLAPIYNGQTDNNVINFVTKTIDHYSQENVPLFRGRNISSTATRRPIFAAYPPAINPNENPDGWTTAISDRGVTFAESSAESARVYTSSGTLKYQKPTDVTPFDIPSALRSQALLPVAVTVTAGHTITVNVTLTGALSNDHVNITPAANLPDGIIIAYARVSANDTITIGFTNITGADIVLNTNVQTIIFRRYY